MGFFDKNSKIELNMMSCPTCGAPIRFANSGEEVECMSCGNKYVAKSSDASDAPSVNTMRIDGIKTSSSAIAYIDQFLDSYDWEQYATDDEIFAIPELERVTENLKITSADDYKTWVASFTATLVPFAKKISMCAVTLAGIVDEYKNGNLDAHSMYDAYKKTVEIIVEKQPEVKRQAELYITYAEKYGIDNKSLSEMRVKLPEIETEEIEATIYDNIEEIPAISEYVEERNSEIAAALLEKGVNAEERYERAKELIGECKYTEAFVELISLDGYRDSIKLANEINHVNSLASIVSYQGEFYNLLKNEKNYSLYKIKDGFKDHKPIVPKISKIVTNFASVLYYFENEKLHGFDLIEKKQVFLSKVPFDSANYYVRLAQSKAYFFASNQKSNSLYELDFRTNTLTKLMEKVEYKGAFCDHFLLYSETVKKDKKRRRIYKAYDLDKAESYEIFYKPFDYCGFVDNSIIFTVNSPDEYNKTLYSTALEEFSFPKILEHNINGECKILSGKIYYYTVDSDHKKYLVSINADGSERHELTPYIKSVLFESGGWVYYVKGNEYNTVLCKVSTDGKETQVIASQIDEFVKYKDGFLYYIDDYRSLCRVRMSGKGKRTLCKNVKEVIAVNGNKAVYTAYDRSVDLPGDLEGAKPIDSIYAIDFDDRGRRKASYDVVDVKLVDDKTVYFTAVEPMLIDGEEKLVKNLYKLDIDTYVIERILTIGIEKKRFNIAIIFTAVCALVSIIGFACQSLTVGFIGLGATVISAIFMFLGWKKPKKK